MHPVRIGAYFDMLSKSQKGYSKILDPVCKKWDLTRSEMDVLLFLYNNPEYDRAADIVTRRGMTKSLVSMSVATLEARGLLQRQCSPTDRRAMHLRLPEAGAIPFDASQFTPGGKDLMGLQEIKLITDLVVAAVAAALCGGGGMAMILSGPIGLVIGAAAGFLLSRGMGAAAEKMMWTLNVPVLMRKLFPTMLFEGGLSRKRDAMIADMQNALIAQLENPDTRTKRMTGAIADAVVAQIAENLQRAVVLLR